MVDGFCFSPSGKYILAQLFTTSIVDDTGKAQDERMILVLDDNGREIKLGGADNLIHDGFDPAWLQDNATIVYLFEAIKPSILFSFKYASVTGGPSGLFFEGRTFLGYDPIPKSNAAIAVERDHNLSGPPRLQRLDLLAQDNQELATLDGYEGGLSVSPSGKRVAYYLDREVLEIRDLTALDHLSRIRIGLGAFRWAPDETAILLKRAPEKKSGELVWVAIPPLTAHPAGQSVPVSDTSFTPILHGLAYRDFAISPDGRFLAVIPPGKRNLAVYPLPSH
jgi:WD40 repeat protein